MLDHYLLPDNPGLSAAMTHVIGMVLLWLMFCAQSVTLSGCMLDGQSPVELACITPNFYLRQFLYKPSFSQVVALNMSSEEVVKEQLGTTGAGVQAPINVE